MLTKKIKRIIVWILMCSLCFSFIPFFTANADENTISVVLMSKLTYASHGSFSEGMISVARTDKYGNSKWGYINSSGVEIIPCQYDFAEPFCEGLAAVARFSKDGWEKWGYIDTSGKVVVSIKYNSAKPFLGGTAAVSMLNIHNGDSWGFIDKTGKEVTPLKYDSIYLLDKCSYNYENLMKEKSYFQDTLTWVKLDEKYGYVDNTGREVVAPKYDKVEPFTEGLAEVKLNGKYGYIDINGKEIISLKYDNAENFSNGVAEVNIGYSERKEGDIIYVTNGNWGLIDTSGRELVSPKYSYMAPFCEGLALVCTGGSWPIGESGPGTFISIFSGQNYGYIDTTGKEVIPLVYENGESFSEGLAAVKKNGKWGYIDATGKEIVPITYDFSFEFINGFAMVRNGDKWGYVDNTGKEIIAPKYDYACDFSEGLACVKLNGKYGFIDTTGKEVIPFQYDYWGDFEDGIAQVMVGTEWVCIDTTGKRILSSEGGWTGGYSEGFKAFSVERNDRSYYGYQDKTGKVVITPQYTWASDFSNGFAVVELNGKVGVLGINRNGMPIVQASTGSPIITFVGIDHSPIVVGDNAAFTIATSNAESVQYRVLLKSQSSGIWEDLTSGYTEPISGKTPYEVRPSKVFSLGKYTLRIYSRRTSDSAETFYDVQINCVTRDDSNRIYANGDMVINKSEFNLGETVSIGGIVNIGGIKGPYKYRLHIYNVTKNIWQKNITAYNDSIDWKPTEPGTYILDVHINSVNSTTWPIYTKNINSTNLYGTYEAWKLKTITVVGNTKDNNNKSTI